MERSRQRGYLRKYQDGVTHRNAILRPLENELEQRYNYDQADQENNTNGTAKELQHVNLTSTNGLDLIDPYRLNSFPLVYG